MQDIQDQFKNSVPRLVGALAILLIGLLVAAIAAAIVRGAVRRSGLDKRIAQRVAGREQSGTVDVAPIVGRAVFYLIMLFVLIAAFQALNLTLVTQPLLTLLSSITGYIPKLLGAGILLLIAWILATILRAIVVQGLGAVRLDERVGQATEGGTGGMSLTRSLGEAVYYIVFLLFLPAILSTLGLTGILVPVQNVIDTTLGFLPRLISAAFILIVGIFVARLVRSIVTNLLAAAGADRLSERIGLAAALGNQRLSGTIGLLVYILILLPVLTAALDALKLASLTEPASAMINKILSAIPNIFAAALTVIIAYVIGRVLAGVIANLLTGVGFNQVPARLGLNWAQMEGARTPADLVGLLIQVALVWFAVIAALGLLGFTQVAAVLTGMVTLAGHILLGLIIFVIGLWLARLTARAVQGSGVANPGLLSAVAQGAVLMLVGAIALKQMGVADSIINLAFGLLLGAAAVAAAIAFGIGGRDAAARELDRLAQANRLPPGTAPTQPDGTMSGED